jgi:hypothetical protein
MLVVLVVVVANVVIIDDGDDAIEVEEVEGARGTFSLRTFEADDIGIGIDVGVGVADGERTNDDAIDDVDLVWFFASLMLKLIPCDDDGDACGVGVVVCGDGDDGERTNAFQAASSSDA